MEKQTLKYESPEVEILAVETEQVFAASYQDMNPEEWTE